MMRRVVRKWTPFAIWLLVVWAIRTLLNRHQYNAQDHDDAWLLFVASCVIGVSVLIMLVDTGEWTARRLGVFGLVLFGGLLYGLTTSVTLWHWATLGQHDFNWIRALILVSTPLLALSQFKYIRARVLDWWNDRKKRKETA